MNDHKLESDTLEKFNKPFILSQQMTFKHFWTGTAVLIGEVNFVDWLSSFIDTKYAVGNKLWVDELCLISIWKNPQFTMFYRTCHDDQEYSREYYPFTAGSEVKKWSRRSSNQGGCRLWAPVLKPLTFSGCYRSIISLILSNIVPRYKIDIHLSIRQM